MKAVKKLDNYRMYKVGSSHELWFGKYNEGAFVGYISDPDNFEMAVHFAEETAKHEIKLLKEEINELKGN
jgi:hypothetical protein